MSATTPPPSPNKPNPSKILEDPRHYFSTFASFLMTVLISWLLTPCPLKPVRIFEEPCYYFDTFASFFEHSSYLLIPKPPKSISEDILSSISRI
jgi:hypothetical protein